MSKSTRDGRWEGANATGSGRYVRWNFKITRLIASGHPKFPSGSRFQRSVKILIGGVLLISVLKPEPPKMWLTYCVNGLTLSKRPVGLAVLLRSNGNRPKSAKTKKSGKKGKRQYPLPKTNHGGRRKKASHKKVWRRNNEGEHQRRKRKEDPPKTQRPLPQPAFAALNSGNCRPRC